MGLPIGSVVVTSAGTAAQVVASGNAVSAVSFKARMANAGAVYLGDDGVDAASGYELNPGDEITLSFREAIDLRRFYVDAANSNDSLDYAGVSS